MNRLRSWYGRHFLAVDLAFAACVGAAFALSMWMVPLCNYYVQQILNDNRAPLYGAFASVFGSLLGFSIAAVAIVLDAVQSPRLTAVRKSHHYQTLWTTFKSSVRWLAFATAASLIALAVDRDVRPMPLLTAIVVAAGLAAATRIAHTIWILEQVIGIATQSSVE